MAVPLRQALRRAAAPMWQAIFRHPFIVEIGAGTLPREKFTFFICQDSLYLRDFARVLCLGGAKAQDRERMDLFARHAHSSLLFERTLHHKFARRLSLTQRAVGRAPRQP